MGAAVCSFSSMGRGFLKMGAPLIPESQCKILIAADLGNHQSSPGQNEAFFSLLGISMSRVTIINEQLKSLPIKKKNASPARLCPGFSSFVRKTRENQCGLINWSSGSNYSKGISGTLGNQSLLLLENQSAQD